MTTADPNRVWRDQSAAVDSVASLSASCRSCGSLLYATWSVGHRPGCDLDASPGASASGDND